MAYHRSPDVPHVIVVTADDGSAVGAFVAPKTINLGAAKALLQPLVARWRASGWPKVQAEARKQGFAAAVVSFLEAKP